MSSFDNDSHSPGVQFIHQQIGDRLGQTFLYLRAPGHNIDDTSQLAESQHFSIRYIANVSLSHERQ